MLRTGDQFKEKLQYVGFLSETTLCEFIEMILKWIKLIWIELAYLTLNLNFFSFFYSSLR